MTNIAFNPGSRTRCPHCGILVQFLAASEGWPKGQFDDGTGGEIRTQISSAQCPSCSRPVVALNVHKRMTQQTPHRFFTSRFIHPAIGYRTPLPNDLSQSIKSDYEEAVLVLPDSEKASAALSRRCLQMLLRETAKTEARDLADQIDEVLPKLPGYLQQQLDAVRNIGNFASHPIKSKSTGEIVDVEAGEAEWNLEVLDLLFDFYYTQPKLAQEKRDALNKKLAELGKPPMK